IPPRLGHDVRIGSEELRRNRMLIRFEIEVSERARLLGRSRGGDYAMTAGELGHDEPAAALFADQPTKYRVRDAGHGSKNGRRSDPPGSLFVLGWKHLLISVYRSTWGAGSPPGLAALLHRNERRKRPGCRTVPPADADRNWERVTLHVESGHSKIE